MTRNAEQHQRCLYPDVTRVRAASDGLDTTTHTALGQATIHADQLG